MDGFKRICSGPGKKLYRTVNKIIKLWYGLKSATVPIIVIHAKTKFLLLFIIS